MVIIMKLWNCRISVIKGGVPPVSAPAAVLSLAPLRAQTTQAALSKEAGTKKRL
jgi:hypothetical protein